MVSKKVKGVIIIAIVLFAIFYVAKLNAKIKSLESDNKALEDKQIVAEQEVDEDDEKVEEVTTETPTTEAPTTEAPTTEAPTTEAPTTEAPTTEAPATEAPTTEAPTTETVVEAEGVDLLSIHTLIGDKEDYFEEYVDVMDNIGNVHKHTYYMGEFDPFDNGDRANLVFLLNKEYNTLVIENIGLPDECKDADEIYYLTFYGDGEYIGGTSEFTAGVYPQERIEIDVTGVQELRVNFVKSSVYGLNGLIVDEMTLY